MEKLKSYQLEGIEWIKQLPPMQGGLLLDEMGLGKSIQALLGFIDCKKVLIICSKTLIKNWGGEIKKWGLDINKYTIINYDKIKRFNHQNINQFDGIIIDEIHNLRNKLTFNYFYLGYLIHNFKGKIIGLSGTPIVNNKTDLSSILQLINLDYRVNKEISPDKYILRRTKKDVKNDIDVKKVTCITIKTSLNEWQKMNEKQIKLENNVGISGWKQLLNMKENNITPYLTNTYKNVYPVMTDKIAVFKYYLEQELQKGNKCLIYSQYLRFLNFLSENVLKNMPHKIISGKVSKKKRTEIVNEFQTDDEVKILLLTYFTGGEGLNLTKANVVFYLDYWWTWASFIQSINRIIRFGQEKDIIIYRFETEYEEKLNKIIWNKRDLLKNIPP